jgi:tRNA A-37 threonylcarbamoyl transferase component Bud32
MESLKEKYPVSLYFIKENVSINEYELHTYVYNLGIVNTPKLFEYNEETKVMVMERLDGMSVSDMYGSEAECVDTEIFSKIRNIVQLLLDHGIEYPDITGYNFMEYNAKIWVIDFGDAHHHINGRIENRFIAEFLDQGQNRWNPDFL